ncbi:MAG: hypothetical protein KJ566_00390 [Nanoarchaeota archaeon]|nr:hypothetical protein [Nanoarchaeota archaeon]
MGALDKITQMKHQGMSDQDIMTALKEQGMSPRNINEGFSQAKVKNAVTNPENNQEIDPNFMENPPAPVQSNFNPNAYSQPAQENSYEPPQNTYEPPVQQESYAPQQQNVYAPAPQENYAPAPQTQEEYYPQENYGSTGYDDYNSGTNTDTTIEISEQVFEEKIKKTNKKITELTEFKNLAETKIENISERLKRIETIIDKLQISILEKIGSYGENLGSIKKEMSMMQDSFGKLVGSSTKKKTHTTHSKKK